MRTRGGLLAIVVVVGLVAGGGLFLDRVAGLRGPSATAAAEAPSGAWLCPHGGGTAGWSVTLTLTNPGPGVVRARVTAFGSKAPGEPQLVSVSSRSRVQVTVPADERGSSSMVEYFGGWIAASWVAQGGGADSGVAAEPCAPAAGRSWFLPDGTTVKNQDAYVVVMNPFNAEAVFSLTVVTEARTVRSKDWSNFLLPPRRTAVFHLNDKVLGDTTVATRLDVSIGRVAASSMGISKKGGIRSAIGTPSPEPRVVLAGVADAGPSEIPVLAPGGRAVTYRVTVLSETGSHPADGLTEERLAPGADQTERVNAPAAALLLQATEGGRLAAARRSFGLQGDQGSTPGVAPRSAWMLSTAAAADGDGVRIYLANPGTHPVQVRLSALSDSGPRAGAESTVNVPPGTTVAVPSALDPGHALDSVLAVAQSGTFVPVEASYAATGSGYAVAAGVPIPARWVP